MHLYEDMNVYINTKIWEGKSYIEIYSCFIRPALEKFSRVLLAEPYSFKFVVRCTSIPSLTLS